MYIINLSDKSKISIDPEEVAVVIAGIQSGKVVKVKQGLFNPSYFVSMTEDEKRLETAGTGRMLADADAPNGQRWEAPSPKKLKDIFGDVLNKKQLK